jgi:hypothetical protein
MGAERFAERKLSDHRIAFTQSPVLYGSPKQPGRDRSQVGAINPANGLVTVIGSFNAGPVNSSGIRTMADIAWMPPAICSGSADRRATTLPINLLAANDGHRSTGLTSTQAAA